MPTALRSDDSQRPFRALVTPLLTIVFAFAAAGCTTLGALPATPGAQLEPAGSEQTAIEQREICVGSSVASAGTLGDTLYYRAAVLPEGKLAVGYFAFFSEERPWGNNWLTWTLFPALAVDLLYTRAVFVGPGLQRALSGKGDVEGFRILYDMQPDGTLAVDRAVADDGSHRLVNLDAADVMRMDASRPTFYSDVWSHQLGGRGLSKMSELAYVRCFGKGHLRPLPDAIANDFTLEGRASPAHVEALGGQAVGALVEVQAKNTKPARPPM